jgi:transposase
LHSFLVSEVAGFEERLSAVEAAFALRVAKLEHERDEYKKLVVILQEQVEKLKRGLLGQKAERLPTNDAQLSLALLNLAMGHDAPPSKIETDEAAPTPEQTIGEHTRKKPSRNAHPSEWPRVPIEVLPLEVQREGLDAFELVGTETREVLERRSASCVVVELIYKKFVRKDRQRNAPTEVFASPALELPIERGVAGPGMLADTIVRRWQDHQPLTRLEDIYRREGLGLAKSTMCSWHEQLAELARPLVDAMFEDAYREPYLCTDATGVLVQAKERCRNGHFWVLVAPEKHVLYRYSKRHDSAAVDALLAGYLGYLVADAHVVYDHLYREGNVFEVACWAHCRRYLFKALASDPERAKVGLAHIGALFRIERTIASSPRQKKEQVRRAKARPIVDKFFDWCDAQAPHVLDETPIQAAITYARNQRIALRRFLDDGRLPAHNNISELNLRRQVLGRRNWLFVGNDDGAKTNTVFVSLLASARLHGLDPVGYLRDLLCLIRAGLPSACSSSLPPIGRRLSSSRKLSKSCSPTSSVASCFLRRPEPRIARHL